MRWPWQKHEQAERLQTYLDGVHATSVNLVLRVEALEAANDALNERVTQLEAQVAGEGSTTRA